MKKQKIRKKLKMVLEKFVLITGCMFSGKTDKLLSIFDKENSVFFCSENTCEKNLKRIPNDFYFISKNFKIFDFISRAQKEEVAIKKILIDEAHLIPKVLIEKIYYDLMNDDSNKYELYIAALNGDFKQDVWETTLFLFSNCSEIIWSDKSKCFSCKDKASYSVRLVPEDTNYRYNYLPSCIRCLNDSESLLNIKKYYEKLTRSWWNVDSLNFQLDDKDLFDKLPDDFKKSISLVLGFFAASDTLVNFNICEKWVKRKDLNPLIIDFLSVQMANENVHSHAYSLLINFFIDLSDQVICSIQ